LTEFYRVYAISIDPAKPLITRLGSIRDQAELSVVYALATRSASGVVPLLSTSHTKSCSSSGSDRESAFARIKSAAVAALELATDHLGPLPGGRLGSFRAAGHSPHIVNGVGGSGPALLDIARRSGEAVGAADSLLIFDARPVLTQVIANTQN
jgi:predicted RNase H-like HicB family nuclease